MVPMNWGRIAWMASTLGRSGLSATTRPSASSVSRSSPHLTVNRYVFRPSITNGTVLVASPSAIGRQPEASGSRVPAWPARLARNSRLITDTAWVEVMPTGLSSTTQPCTSNFSRLRCCFPSAAGGGGPGSGPVSFIFATSLQVALHPLGVQQLLDALGLVEPLVDAEADVGREFQVDAMGDLAAQVALVALERLDHRLLVAAAERHHVDGGELEVRRHAHLGHRDQVGLDDRIMHLA